MLILSSISCTLVLFLANLEIRYMDKLVSSKSPENLRMAKKLSNNSKKKKKKKDI